MSARVTATQAPPDRADDDAGRVITEYVIPGVKGLAGFKGGLWLADRATGRGLAITLFESEEALQSSEAAVGTIRQEAVSRLPGEGRVGGALRGRRERRDGGHHHRVDDLPRSPTGDAIAT